MLAEVLTEAEPGDRYWYDLTAEVDYPDVVVGQSTKEETFRFVEVEPEATVVNNLDGLIWKPDVLPETRTKLLKWLRGKDGQAAVTEMARAQGMGLLKIEPRGLSNVRLPKRFAQRTETLL